MPKQSKSLSKAKQTRGQGIADRILADRKAIRRRRIATLNAIRKPPARGRLARMEGLGSPAALAARGYLIAAGDSWFDYPGAFLLQHDDILIQLEQQGYTVESTAHAGDPIEAMAYLGSGQLYRLARCFERLHDQGQKATAVLLSGGGDDIAGPEFGMLLNNALSPIGGWSDQIVDSVVNARVRGAYQTMIEAITGLAQEYFGGPLPILVHGYDYAVPDGRGFLGTSLFAGPWLKPGFDEKAFDNLQKNVQMIEGIIDSFNKMLADLAKANQKVVYYIDLRNTLPNALPNNAYKKWWANELHPTQDGFAAVTKKFMSVLATL